VVTVTQAVSKEFVNSLRLLPAACTAGSCSAQCSCRDSSGKTPSQTQCKKSPSTAADADADADATCPSTGASASGGRCSRAGASGTYVLPGYQCPSCCCFGNTNTSFAVEPNAVRAAYNLGGQFSSFPLTYATDKKKTMAAAAAGAGKHKK
jgi:hypothetical protein